MTKKLLKQLIEISYKNGSMNGKNILAIADRLSRNDLKQYLKALKKEEKIKNVYIDTAITQTTELAGQFGKYFPDKNIVVRHDPALLVGIKITDNDDVTELNLKHELDGIMEYIEAK